MAEFKKAILTSGAYDLPFRNGKRIEIITPSRLKKWAETANKMIEGGIRIPAPWKHDREALPMSVGSDGTLESSFENAGFWNEFFVENNENGVPTLYGVVDVPGDPDDPASPAYKVGKTVKETSVYVRPEFGDGKGRTWQDAIMHVALVTHPVEPGQDNFIPASEEDKRELAVAMSLRAFPILMGSDNPGDTDVDKASGQDLTELLKNLKEIANIVLPGDTTLENLVERLNAVLLQKGASEKGDSKVGTVNKKPEGAKEETAPVIMALSKEQIQAILEAKAVNPDTGNPFTEEELQKAFELEQPSSPDDVPEDVIMANPKVKQLHSACTFLAKRLNEEVREKIIQRIDKLLKTGRITKEYADEKLAPLVSEFSMSWDDEGNPVKNRLEDVLDALEALPSLENNGAAAEKSLFSGDDFRSYLKMSNRFVEDLPEGFTDGLLDEEEAVKVAEEFCKNTGV